MTAIAPRRRPYTARLPPEERRTQLLDAALQIIVRDGYERVSIDAIAREAGVTRPVVYSVYDGLEPLLYALLDRQEARAVAQLFEALPAGAIFGGAKRGVGETVRRLVKMVASDPLTWRPILFANQGSPEAVRERIARDWERARKRIAALMLLSAPSKKLDVELLSHAVMAALEHFGRLILDDPKRFDEERLVTAAQALVSTISLASAAPRRS
jgi:AcrR family transcriptional regulator